LCQLIIYNKHCNIPYKNSYWFHGDFKVGSGFVISRLVNRIDWFSAKTKEPFTYR